jgi:hypothetical protein
MLMILPMLRVFEGGEIRGNPQSAFCQLAQPNHDNPTYIVGMEPPALVKTTPFHASPQLQQHITLHLERRMVFNLTPKYSFVDLHIGQSTPTSNSAKC